VARLNRVPAARVLELIYPPTNERQKMNIGKYQQQLKDNGVDYVLHQVGKRTQVISSIDNKIVIKNFSAGGKLV
jgi:hypothetical protein